MENKNIGWMLLGISVLLLVLVFLFSSTLNQSVRNSCFVQHGDVESCEMFDTVRSQTYFALVIVGILIIASLFLILSKPNEKVVVKKIKEAKIERKIDTSDLRPEDKQVLKLLQEDGAIFQADLIERTGFGNAKVTRIVDRLEGRGLAERKRRGKTNVVVLKGED